MTPDIPETGRVTAYDPQALQAALGDLGSALDTLGRQLTETPRPAQAAARAALREKARTGTLKPLQKPAAATGKMEAPRRVASSSRGSTPLEADLDWVPLTELASLQHQKPPGP